MKKTEHSLFRAVFDNNKTIMLLVDPDDNQRIIDVNSAAQNFYGYRHEKFLQLNMGDINLKALEERKILMKEAIKGPQNHFNFIHITCDGVLKNVDVDASPLVYNGKKVMFIIVHDITLQNKIELKLRESEFKFRSYFESSPLSLWEQDYSKLILYLNKLKTSVGSGIDEYIENNPDIIKKCSKMINTLNVNHATELLYEANEKENLLLDFESIKTQISYELFKKKVISIYKNEAIFYAETEHITLKGNKIYIRLESIVLANNLVLSIITDITELKSKEKELKVLLLQTKADSETKEILLREINHRVKNNLSSFIGMLYAEKKQYVNDVNAVHMEHVDSLINRVKGISIAHEMLSKSHWTPISVYKLTEKIINSLNHLIPKDRSVVTKINPSELFLDADQSHNLAIIINELFSNSIEHASSQGETIEVLINFIENKGEMFFSYRDSGPGYPEEILKFEFKNVGMYLLKNIIEQSLRGSMKISNEGGAKIEIKFPGGSKLEEL